jgi:hypothetical protein
MPRKFEIFKFFGSSNRVWIAAEPTIEEAQARVQALSVHLPGRYLIRNSATGEVVPPNGAAAERFSSNPGQSASEAK